MITLNGNIQSILPFNRPAAKNYNAHEAFSIKIKVNLDIKIPFTLSLAPNGPVPQNICSY